MASVSLTDQQQIVKILLDFINGNTELPCKVKLETLDTDKPESMMLQQLAGVTKVKYDLVGGFTAEFPFAAYYRVSVGDTLGRIKASGVLNNLGRYFEQKMLLRELPVLGVSRKATLLEMRMQPHKIIQGSDGSETYQAVFMMQYDQDRIIGEG